MRAPTVAPTRAAAVEETPDVRLATARARAATARDALVSAQAHEAAVLRDAESSLNPLARIGARRGLDDARDARLACEETATITAAALTAAERAAHAHAVAVHVPAVAAAAARLVDLAGPLIEAIRDFERVVEAADRAIGSDEQGHGYFGWPPRQLLAAWVDVPARVEAWRAVLRTEGLR